MNEAKLNEMLDELAQEVAQGALLKNIRKRLDRHSSNEEMVSKLIRVIEIRANEFSTYKAA